MEFGACVKCVNKWRGCAVDKCFDEGDSDGPGVWLFCSGMKCG